MEFEWDQAKAASNLLKHGIDFVAATGIFDDPHHIEKNSTRPEHGEARFIAIGMMNDGRLITVVFTDRNGVRRIISARTARNYERREYDQGKTSA